LYYHIFRFPLILEEIRRYSSDAWKGSAELEQSLNELVERELIGRDGQYFFIADPDVVDERRKGEVRAQTILPRARRRSRFISGFPFVRAVAVSGTLSKGVMKPHDDLDFLVITEPGRLWICRFLLMCFKRVFLLNSHRNFCINYFIAADRLAIPDRNLFTATEIAWLLPMVNPHLYRDFVKQNSWVERFLPNWGAAGVDRVAGPRRPLHQRVAETLLEAIGGTRLDEWCRRMIVGYTRRKYESVARERYDMAFRAEKHSSKHHPRVFQEKIINRYLVELRDFEQLHAVVVDDPRLQWR